MNRDKIKNHIKSLLILFLRVIRWMLFSIFWVLGFGIAIAAISEFGWILGGITGVIIAAVCIFIGFMIAIALEKLIKRINSRNDKKVNLNTEKISISKLEEIKVEPVNVHNKTEDYWKRNNELYVQLEKGDFRAMYELAMLQYSMCSSKEQTLIREYEANPCEETESLIKAYKIPSENFKNYIEKLSIAVAYGDERAKSVFDRCKYYKESQKRLILAKLCQMGDIVAMYDMAMYFYNKCNQEQKNALKNYEQNPCENTRKGISFYITEESRENAIDMRFYMMWLIRASVYGNGKAKEITDKCTYYYELSDFPLETVKRHLGITLETNFLYKAGFLDKGIISDEDDTYLEYHKGLSYFKLEEIYVDGYDRETYYRYYDEFFMEIDCIPHRCAVHNEIEQIIEKMERNEKKREQFWKTQNDCNERKYKIRLKCR